MCTLDLTEYIPGKCLISVRVFPLTIRLSVSHGSVSVGRHIGSFTLSIHLADCPSPVGLCHCVSWSSRWFFHLIYPSVRLPRVPVCRHDGSFTGSVSLSALWFRTTKNRDVSTGPLTLPFSCSLTLLNHSFAQHCSPRLCALLVRSACAHHCTHSYAHSLTYSLPSSWKSK